MEDDSALHSTENNSPMEASGSTRYTRSWRRTFDQMR